MHRITQTKNESDKDNKETLICDEQEENCLIVCISPSYGPTANVKGVESSTTIHSPSCLSLSLSASTPAVLLFPGSRSSSSSRSGTRVDRYLVRRMPYHSIPNQRTTTQANATNNKQRRRKKRKKHNRGRYPPTCDLSARMAVRDSRFIRGPRASKQSFWYIHHSIRADEEAAYVDDEVAATIFSNIGHWEPIRKRVAGDDAQQRRTTTKRERELTSYF